MSNSQILRRIWWLDPQILFALAVAGTMLVAVLSPVSFYAEYGSPKYVDWSHFGLALVAVAAFVLGCRFGLRIDPGPADTESADRGRLRVWFWLALGLTTVGYLVWTYMAVKNGLSLGLVKQFLFGSDESTFTDLKSDVFVRIPGITTATQFAASAVLLGLLVWHRGDKWSLWLIGGLGGLTLVRALLYSERLAFIEIALPAFILAFRCLALGKPLSPFYHRLWQAAPIAGIAGLIVLFGTFEYFRSWKSHQKNYDSIAEFTLQRLSAYYNMAHNNSAMLLDKDYRYPMPYGTLQFFWQFPLVKLSPIAFHERNNYDPDDHFARLLQLHANEELNNDGGLFQPVYDFGWIGYPLFWCAWGVAAGYLYRSYLGGRLAGLMLYPVLVVGILETPRLLYLTDQRIFPTLALLIGFVWYERHHVAAALQRRKRATEAGGLTPAGAGR